MTIPATAPLERPELEAGAPDPLWMTDPLDSVIDPPATVAAQNEYLGEYCAARAWSLARSA